MIVYRLCKPTRTNPNSTFDFLLSARTYQKLKSCLNKQGHQIKLRIAPYGKDHKWQREKAPVQISPADLLITAQKTSPSWIEGLIPGSVVSLLYKLRDCSSMWLSLINRVSADSTLKVTSSFLVSILEFTVSKE